MPDKIQIYKLLYPDIRHPDFHPLIQKSRSQNMYFKTILTLGTVAAVSYLDRVASSNIPDIRETVPINIALIGKEADFYTPLGREPAKHLPLDSLLMSFPEKFSIPIPN